MATSKNLDQLVGALPVEERKELYERIQRSLSLQTEEEQKIYHADLPKARREEIIQEEIQALGLWDRVVYWFMRLVSHRPDDEVFLRYKMNRLRRRILSAGAQIVDFPEKFLLPDAGARVFQLYQAVYPMIPVFRRIWKDTQFFQEMISYLLEKRIPDAKTELNQFMPMKEMQDLFMQTEKKESIRTEVTSRLERYLGSLQADMFSHLEAGLLPLYLLKGVCLFPYEAFFAKMGKDIGYGVPETIPDFSAVRIIDIVQNLEELYFAIYSTRRLPQNVFIHNELIEYYIDNTEQERISLIGAEAGVARESADPEELPGVDEPLDEAGETEGQGPDQRSRKGEIDARNERLSALRKSLRRAKEVADRVHRTLPLAEIIKYFREDPYYRFLVYMPRLNLREYYSSALTVNILSQIENRLEDVRMGVIGRMITHIFGTEPPDFEHYRASTFSWVKKLGLPAVRYTKSLNILFNYIRLHYFGELHELVQGLSRIIPVRHRDEQSSMLNHATGLEDLMDKIHTFDLSFSPETDEGKSFMRMRVVLEKDPALQRTFRILMAQKDREARGLLDKGAEHIQGLQTVFGNLLKANEQAFSGRLSQLRGTQAENRDLNSMLSEYVETFVFLRKLLNQLIAMEEGY
ncbi:MAG TPA: DUF5312 family protein [Spirochaetia bacterium]|nr:DUF5312 family protein [Spirochaetia bacterium]